MRHFLHLHISVINELLKGFADDLVKFSLDSSAVALFFLSHQLFSADEPGIYQLTLTYKFNKILCNQLEQNFFLKNGPPGRRTTSWLKILVEIMIWNHHRAVKRVMLAEVLVDIRKK